MKKSWPYVLGALLVVLAVGATVIAKNNRGNHSDETTSTSTAKSLVAQTSKLKQACAVFTLADAKQILGENAKGGQNGAETLSDDIRVSTCTYAQDYGSNVAVSASKSASLLVRAPKSSNGITSNQTQFGRLKPTDVEDVMGYGDSAYWSQQYGQLNVLKNNTWYIVSYGPITPAGRTLEQTKQLADILIKKM